MIKEINRKQEKYSVDNMTKLRKRIETNLHKKNIVLNNLESKASDARDSSHILDYLIELWLTQNKYKENLKKQYKLTEEYVYDPIADFALALTKPKWDFMIIMRSGDISTLRKHKIREFFYIKDKK